MTDQQNKPSNQVGTVQAAARLAFQGSTATGAAKLRVCNQLLLTCKSTRYTPSTVQLPLEAAAQAAWMSPVGLLPILKADACFKVVETQSAAAASKGYVVALNCYAILDKARRNTTTGILTEELPPPKGYTDGVHPLRPGALWGSVCVCVCLGAVIRVAHSLRLQNKGLGQQLVPKDPHPRLTPLCMCTASLPVLCSVCLTNRPAQLHPVDEVPAVQLRPALCVQPPR